MLRVLPLGNLDVSEGRRFGAKALSLARLARLDLRVPDGFALSFDASRSDKLDPEEQATLLAAYAALCSRAGESDARVAVRSSAVDEDGTERSFAGLYETRLDVERDGLVAAVEGCLASQQSERADAYRRAAGGAMGAMGILVQRMVAADYAGVCFTRSPLDEDEIAVEVVAGLGEGLVSGARSPARALFGRSAGDLRVESDPDDILDEFGQERLREVVRIALVVEEAFGHPVDVEWAFAEGAFALLQARPITARARAGAGAMRALAQSEIRRLGDIASRAGEVLVWSDFSVADMQPRPSTLGLELMNRLAGDDGSVARSLRRLGLRYRPKPRLGDHFPEIGGRMYLNFNALLFSIDEPLPIALDLAQLDLRDGRSVGLEEIPLRLAWRGWGLALRIPAALLRFAVVAVRFLRLRRDFDSNFRRKVEPAVTAEAARLRERDLSGLSLSELWSAFDAHIRRFVELHYYHQMTDYFAFATHAFLRLGLRHLYGDEFEAVEIGLTTGLPGNMNTESNLDLARVASGTLALDDFIERYGHRGNPDYEISAPRWREEPERLEAMASTIASTGRDSLAQFEKQRRIRTDAEAQFSADVLRNRWLRPFHGALLRQLDYYQRYSPLREATQGISYHFIELGRRVLLEAAERLDFGELIFFLTLDEIERLLCSPEPGSELASRAHERRERLRAVRKVYLPHALRSDQLDAIGRVPTLAPGTTELRGQAVSAGLARGRARVVQTLDEARELEAGEILVTASADPSWTPLFLVAGGLVLEQGALLSHPAIVAREYGLPAVVNVAGATQLLVTGQEITIDGDGGRVLLADGNS